MYYRYFPMVLSTEKIEGTIALHLPTMLRGVNLQISIQMRLIAIKRVTILSDSSSVGKEEQPPMVGGRETINKKREGEKSLILGGREPPSLLLRGL